MKGWWCVLVFIAVLLMTMGVDFSAGIPPSFHVPRPLSTSKAKEIANLVDIDNVIDLANEISVERVVDTPSHTQVQEFIAEKLRFAGWKVSHDPFYEDTPFGNKNFVNIIGKFGDNPNVRTLVVAAHYDSKYFKQFKFLAATDSAVPCAILLEFARLLPLLVEKFGNNKAMLNIKLVFFDGEEAFKDWTATDSIYGARHLAETWGIERGESPKFGSKLDEIDLLLLLDLLGAKNPTFYDYFEATSASFKRLASIEELMQTRVLGTSQAKRYFQLVQRYNNGIEDDHIPFVKRGIRCLHLIPTPFPKEWHTVKDTMDIVDRETTLHLTRVILQFIAEYTHLVQ